MAHWLGSLLDKGGLGVRPVEVHHRNVAGGRWVLRVKVGKVSKVKGTGVLWSLENTRSVDVAGGIW